MAKYVAKFKPKEKDGYDAVPTIEDSFSSSSSAPSSELWESEDDTPRRPSSRPNWPARLFLGSTIFFATVSVWLLSEIYRHSTTSCGFERGLDTELATVSKHIQLQQVEFSGGLSFTDNGTEYMTEDRFKRPQYVGTPSKEIDHAWAMLHFGRFFLLTEEEARQAWGDKYKEFWAPKHGGYATELDVFHSLHCIDYIRKAFYPEVYPLNSIHGTVHRDHCLEHIRQVTMCHADLTPLPTRFHPGIDQNYIDFELGYTCRNFDSIRAWTTERWRASADMAVDPEGDPALLWGYDEAPEDF